MLPSFGLLSALTVVCLPLVFVGVAAGFEAGPFVPQPATPNATRGISAAAPRNLVGLQRGMSAPSSGGSSGNAHTGPPRELPILDGDQSIPEANHPEPRGWPQVSV